MHPKLIYVAKPPTAYASHRNLEGGWCSSSHPSVCSNCCRTVEESLPVPLKPCIYGSVGSGRPNPSIRSGRCPWTTPLSPPSSNATSTTSIVSTEGTNYRVVRNGPPERPTEQPPSYNTHSLITNNETSPPPTLQPGDLIYLTTPQGPRYYFDSRPVNNNSTNYMPTAQSRGGYSYESST